jgi:hypothetical protein
LKKIRNKKEEEEDLLSTMMIATIFVENSSLILSFFSVRRVESFLANQPTSAGRGHEQDPEQHQKAQLVAQAETARDHTETRLRGSQCHRHFSQVHRAHRQQMVLVPGL